MPDAADNQTARGCPSASRSSRGGSPVRSILLKIRKQGTSAAPISVSTASTWAMMSSRSGWPASITCNNRLASQVSRGVEAEGCHQLVRKTADETHGIGQHDRLGAWQIQPPQRWIRVANN